MLGKRLNLDSDLKIVLELLPLNSSTALIQSYDWGKFALQTYDKLTDS